MLSTLSIEEAVAYDDVCQQEVAYVLTIGAQSTDRTPRAGHIQCNTGDRWKAESSMSIDKTTAVPYPWGYFWSTFQRIALHDEVSMLDFDL